MSSNVNVYDAPPLRRTGVFDTTTTSGGDLHHTHRRISWAAIFGGVILVVAVQLLLSQVPMTLGNAAAVLCGSPCGAGVIIRSHLWTPGNTSCASSIKGRNSTISTNHTRGSRFGGRLSTEAV